MYEKKCLLKNLVAWVVPALFLGLAVPVPVQAGDLYAGVGFGSVKMNDNNTCGAAKNLLNPGYSCTSGDTTNNGLKLVGGYQLMDILGFELSYLNFGGTNANASGTVNGAPATARTEFEAKGFAFAGVGTLSITKEFAVIGRVGIFRWNVKSTASIPGGSSASAVTNDTKTGFTL